MTTILTESNIDLPLLARGKVRDIYDLGDKLLIVATDRISAFDVVLPTGIPDKGAVLTQLSAFWFEKTGDIVPNHFIRVVDDTRVEGVPVELPREVIGRAMVVQEGAAHRRRVHRPRLHHRHRLGGLPGDRARSRGVKLPTGLVESEELHGADLHADHEGRRGPRHADHATKQVVELEGARGANAMMLRSLALYQFGRQYARERGIIIADTKFEFGWLDDTARTR